MARPGPTALLSDARSVAPARTPKNSATSRGVVLSLAKALMTSSRSSFLRAMPAAIRASFEAFRSPAILLNISSLRVFSKLSATAKHKSLFKSLLRTSTSRSLFLPSKLRAEIAAFRPESSMLSRAAIFRTSSPRPSSPECCAASIRITGSTSGSRSMLISSSASPASCKVVTANNPASWDTDAISRNMLRAAVKRPRS